MSKADKKPSNADKMKNQGSTNNTPLSSDTEGVDKIRELIFGVQMQDYEKKFEFQEKEFLSELNKLRVDTKNWFDTLEKYIKDEVESLSGQITSEKNERTDANRESLKKLDETRASLQKTIDTFAEQTKINEKELRSQLLDQSKQLRTEMQQSSEKILEKLEQAVSALRDEKTDRKSLSMLLMEVALKLNDDVRIEDLEKLKNG